MATFSLMPTGYSPAHKMIRESIVTEAREWLGTPWIHHQSCKQYGADCVGFLAGVAAYCGIEIGKIENYYRTPEADSLYRELAERFTIIDFRERQKGDIVLFTIKRIPRHVGILSERDRFIHCSNRFGVVEVQLDRRWKKRGSYPLIANFYYSPKNRLR